MYQDSTRLQYLKEMGIDVWVDRDTPPPEPATSTVARQDDVASDIAVSHIEDNADLVALRDQVASCTSCSLHESRTQTVFGVGNASADWLVIGEAPGAEEDSQGEPFVGRAGKLLNAMLLAIGLEREQVFIANILKCRPPNNRDPKPEEVQACDHFLKRQIELLQPKLILCVGRIAAQNLLKVDTPIGKMRGKRFQLEGSDIPVMVTYHPAYLLRSPREKRKVWADLKQALRLYREQA